MALTFHDFAVLNRRRCESARGRRNCEIAGVPFDADRYDEFDVTVAYSNARVALSAIKALPPQPKAD